VAKVKANGIEIEYETAGNKSDPALLLVMGLGAQLTIWPDSLFQGLAARGFHVIRFDNRDTGLSTDFGKWGVADIPGALQAAMKGETVKAPYHLNDMAADAVGLLDALGIDKAHMVGASMGGMIAQLLAARFPERVLTLTSIMSSSGNRKVSKPKRRALQVLMRRLPAAADAEAIVAHLVDVFTVIGSPGYPTDRRELRERLARSVRRAYDPAGTARQLVAVIACGDRRKLLRGIAAPTLVIHGSDDPLVPVEAGYDTARNIPGATMQVIGGMGHDLPDALLPTLADAIVRHCRRGLATVRGPGTPR
jgi:pimeloyl-ACP methyl ester carboxylesterase